MLWSTSHQSSICMENVLQGKAKCVKTILLSETCASLLRISYGNFGMAHNKLSESAVKCLYMPSVRVLLAWLMLKWLYISVLIFECLYVMVCLYATCILHFFCLQMDDVPIWGSLIHNVFSTAWLTCSAGETQCITNKEREDGLLWLYTCQDLVEGCHGNDKWNAWKKS